MIIKVYSKIKLLGLSPINPPSAVFATEDGLIDNQDSRIPGDKGSSEIIRTLYNPIIHTN